MKSENMLKTQVGNDGSEVTVLTIVVKKYVNRTSLGLDWGLIYPHERMKLAPCIGHARP